MKAIYKFLGISFCAAVGAIIGFKVNGTLGLAIGLIEGGLFGMVVDHVITQYAWISFMFMKNKSDKKRCG